MILLTPWIIFGFLHQNQSCLKLNQSRASLALLLTVEIVYFLTLSLTLGSSHSDTAGNDSFAWKYYLIYAKGIFPVFVLAEQIEPTGGDYIDQKYKVLYLICALIIDYIILYILSPKLQRFIRKLSPSHL